MPQGNGNSGSDRLDRIERALETLVTVSGNFATAIGDLQQGHKELQQDHKLLLTAQVVLTDRLDKLTVRVDSLTESQQHTDERLNALIRVMDEWIRSNPRPPQQ